MNFIYSKSLVYRTRLFRYKYNSNFSKLVLCKALRESGFEEEKNYILLSNREEVERVSLSRTQRNIKELALCNDFEYFYTQTFSPHVVDRFCFNDVQNLLRSSFKAYKRVCRDFKFLVIYEHHKDGAIHLHGLLKGLRQADIYTNDFGYLSNKFFDKLGFNSFSKILDYNKCCNYITKYISKDCIKSEHNQIYYCSRGLNKANREEIYFDNLDTLNCQWDFENDFVKIKNEMGCINGYH